MDRPILIIGNRNYSSWSLRAWLALEAAGVEFDEIVVPLGTPETEANILRWCPTGRVPAYRDGELLIWDSLAICEYAAEICHRAPLWPSDPAVRAVARSVVSEMHSGFVPLRKHMPMNLRAEHSVAELPEGVDTDIQRIDFIWETCRANYGTGGDMLFGDFTIADAFFAPVVSRFRTYGVALPGAAGKYMEAVWALPAMQDWADKAHAERWKVERYDR